MSSYESSKNPFDTSEGGLAVEEYTDEIGEIDEIDEKIKDFSPEAISTDNHEKEKEEIVDMKKEHDVLMRHHEQKLSTAERLQYEENQRVGFQHVFKLDNQIKALEESLPLLEARKEYSGEDLDIFQTEKHDLEVKLAMRDKVNQFETKLWGNSPAEYMTGRQELLSDIASVEKPDDISNMFKKWGALPGANTLDAPVVNETAVSYFIKHINDYSDHDAHAHAEKLLPHKRLREKILAFKSIPKQALEVTVVSESMHNAPEEADPLAKIREASPDVWDEKRDIPSPRQRIPGLPQTIQTVVEIPPVSVFESQRKPLITVEELELQLKEQEEALLQAKEVIGSKLFEYAPFLMKFTKKGREGLAILKKAGIDIGTRGATVASIEMARSFKLKSLRDREAMKNEETPRFAHDLVARKQSVEKAEQSDMQIPITSAMGERIRDIKDQREMITKRKHVKNIQKVLTPNMDFTSSNSRRSASIKKLDGEEIKSEINRFNAANQIRRRASEKQRVLGNPNKETRSDLMNENGWRPDTDEHEIPILTKSEKVKKSQLETGPIFDVVRGSSEEYDDMSTTAEMSIADLSPENRSTVEIAREQKLPKKLKEIKIRDRKAMARFNNKKARRKETTENMREVTQNNNLTHEQARVEVRARNRKKSK